LLKPDHRALRENSAICQRSAISRQLFYYQIECLYSSNYKLSQAKYLTAAGAESAKKHSMLS